MKIRSRRGPTLLLATLILLLPSVAPAQDVGTVLRALPGLNPAQVQVGAAIDSLCPKLGGRFESLTSAQRDLFARCSDMKFQGLSLDQLPDVLGKVTSEETATLGNNSIETRAGQFRPLAARLAALRLGATGVSLSGLRLDLDGKTVSAAPLGFGDRAGGASADDALWSRLGAFVNGVGSFGSKNATSREAGFDFHSVGVTAGVDYRFTDSLVAGLALNYVRTDADISFALGELDSDNYGLSLYGTYYVGPLYVDLLGGFTRHDYNTTRRIVYSPAPGFTGQAVDRTARGDTDGNQVTFNVGAGYDVRLGAVTVTPYARLEYLHLHIDGYTESGANGLDLRINKQTVESLLTVLGGRFAYALSTPFGVLVPQVRGEWRHESLNEGRAIRAQFANDPFNTVFAIPTDDPDRNYAAVGVGVSGVFRKGMAAFVDFETIVGLRGVTNHNFTAGVRVEF